MLPIVELNPKYDLRPSNLPIGYVASTGPERNVDIH